MAIKISLKDDCKQAELANSETFAFCKQQIQDIKPADRTEQFAGNEEALKPIERQVGASGLNQAPKLGTGTLVQ